MKKIIIIAIIILFMLTCIIPFGGYQSPYYEGMRIGDEISYYNTIVWQYTYSCVSMHNDHSITMGKRIDLFGTFTIYEQEEKMMRAYSGGLTEWTEPSCIDHIY